jgi:hypothetical protein
MFVPAEMYMILVKDMMFLLSHGQIFTWTIIVSSIAVSQMFDISISMLFSRVLLQ